MSENLIAIVSRTSRESQLVRAARMIRTGIASDIETNRLRTLTEREILVLRRLGSSAEDWSRIRVANGFDPRRVRHCHFQGDIDLGNFSESVMLPEGVRLPSGLYHSTLADCVIGDNVLVRHVDLLARYVVGEAAILTNCRSIACTRRTAFGNGQTLPLGNETSGRDLPVYAEITLPVAAALTRHPTRQQFLSQYQVLIADYLNDVYSTRGIIEAGAIVRNTPKLWNSYLGPCAAVEEAAAVESCTLLSSADEPTRIQSGANVNNCLMQWGSSCSSGALVDQAVLMEHAHVERHGKVIASVIGPNTTIAQGEVSASLVGPFVGFHHQALLIAVRWPEGKGNVSHGAAVGCNHTSRAPDQECWLGEGTFLGLGVEVRYPVDLSLAPYSIVASGAVLAPQKMVFPFSLINTPSKRPADVPNGCNELLPAWVLSDNLYAIQRARSKFRSRNRATRHTFDFEVFRPETIDRVRDAARRLRAVEITREVYTEQEVPGLGKNFLCESRRCHAAGTYEFFIRYYALLGLLERMANWLNDDPSDADQLLTTTSADPHWEHQRQLLCDDLRIANITAGLRDLPDMLECIALGVEQSKRKDDRRGEQIIDDYATASTPAHRDPVVRGTWSEVRRLQAEARTVLASWESRSLGRNGKARPTVVFGSS